MLVVIKEMTISQIPKIPFLTLFVLSFYIDLTKIFPIGPGIPIIRDLFVYISTVYFPVSFH